MQLSHRRWWSTLARCRVRLRLSPGYVDAPTCSPLQTLSPLISLALAAEWALECLKVLLETNMQQNLQIVVNVAKEYTEQLTAEKIIELLESHKSYHGLYFYLGAHLAFSENPEVWRLDLVETRPVQAQGSSSRGGC